jgi:hypothetical protein
LIVGRVAARGDGFLRFGRGLRHSSLGQCLATIALEGPLHHFPGIAPKVLRAQNDNNHFSAIPFRGTRKTFSGSPGVARLADHLCKISVEKSILVSYGDSFGLVSALDPNFTLGRTRDTPEAVYFEGIAQDQTHVASRRDMAAVRQAVRVSEVRIACPHLSSACVHPLGELLHASVHALGHDNRRIIGRLQHERVQ